MPRKAAPDEIRYEHPDPNPIELHIPDRRAPNTLDGLLREARHRQMLQAQLMDETFEESDDFDVEDDMPDYGNTRWEVAADAAQLTPEELFQRVYGISKAEAQKRLQELTNPPAPTPPSSLVDRKEGGTAATAAGGGQSPPTGGRGA